MAFTWYKSATDDGGEKSSEITSGTVNEVFNSLTSQERLNGSFKARKIYIESDAELEAYIGLADTGDYNAYLIESSGSSEVVGDLTGDETTYGAGEVTSATETAITVKNDAYSQIFSPAQDIIVSGDIVRIDTVTDNGDGTSTLALRSAITYVPSPQEYVTSVLQLSLPAATAVPFWVIIRVPPGSPRVSAYNTVPLVVAY